MNNRLLLAFVVFGLCAFSAGALIAWAATKPDDTQRICISAIGPVTIGPEKDDVTGGTLPQTTCYTKKD